MVDRPVFKYVGGNPALDFVNTVDWSEEGLSNERITGYDAFIRWAEGAGLLSRRRADQLRALARGNRGAAERAYRRALQLRGVLQRVVTSLVRASRRRGERVSAAHLAELNTWLAGALRHLRLAANGSVASLSWTDAQDNLESPSWELAWRAAQLIASDESHLLRVCAGPECGWVYVDRSRNGLRRWCEMSTCGTLQKSMRRRRRAFKRAAAKRSL